MKRRRLNSSADVDRYLNIKSMNGDNTKYAYDLEITNENSRSIYAVSNVYGWTYKVDKNTTAVYLDGKKIADDCVYSIDEYFDVERPVNSSKKPTSNLNCSDNDTVTLTLAYYAWRLVYTCLVYYEERLDLYNDSNYQRNYTDIINTVESALHGDLDTLIVNSGVDELSQTTLTDGNDVSIQFTVLESQLIYKAVYHMEDTLYDADIFSEDDNSDCEAIREYFERQLGMTVNDIFDATNVSSNRRGVVKNRGGRTLNSAVSTQFDEKAFDKYLDGLVDDCLEAIMEQGVEAAVLETKVPGYDSDWCAAELTVPMNKAINKIKPIIREYYKAVYFGNK